MDLVISRVFDTFRIQKCLETVKRQNPLYDNDFSRDLVIPPVSKHCQYSKGGTK